MRRLRRFKQLPSTSWCPKGRSLEAALLRFLVSGDPGLQGELRGAGRHGAGPRRSAARPRIVSRSVGLFGRTLDAQGKTGVAVPAHRQRLGRAENHKIRRHPTGGAERACLHVGCQEQAAGSGGAGGRESGGGLAYSTACRAASDTAPCDDLRAGRARAGTMRLGCCKSCRYDGDPASHIDGNVAEPDVQCCRKRVTETTEQAPGPDAQHGG